MSTSLKNHKVYHTIGLMSGSSLDGLDVAYCIFTKNEKWAFEIKAKECYPFPIELYKQLKNIASANDSVIKLLDKELAFWMADRVNEFIISNNLKDVDVIGSHGHTVKHHPDLGYTLQIGCGQTIANKTGITTANNLRQKDIDLGGQGAPIVPIGDLHLFAEYDFLLNIGGIANITIKQNNSIIAFDICSANQVLNKLAQQLGKPYDAEGRLAESGTLDTNLLNELNKLDYYKKSSPKSLDNSFTNRVLEIVDASKISIEDKLNTYCEHIAYQIAQSLKGADGKMLVTGGGAFNTHLVDRISAQCDCSVFIPNSSIVEYKEAMVMAFMGVLKLREEVNVLSSVTGASADSVCGDLYK